MRRSLPISAPGGRELPSREPAGLTIRRRRLVATVVRQADDLISFDQPEYFASAVGFQQGMRCERLTRRAERDHPVVQQTNRITYGGGLNQIVGCHQNSA